MTNQPVAYNIMRGPNPEIRTADRTALLVSPDPSDRILLETLFQQQNWKFHAVTTVESAVAFLRHTPVPLVITERNLPAGGWQHLLRAAQDIPGAPLVVVVSRLADEHLWSEVLHLGGHDVLTSPIYPPEALRVFSYAFDRWAAAREPHKTGTMRRKAAAGQ